MYYKYRKQIYTVLIIVVLLSDFLIGKSMGGHTTKKQVGRGQTSAVVVDKNTNYRQAITINGTNYSSAVTVNKATIEDNSLKIDVNESDNSGVASYKVLAYGNNNNILPIKEIAEDTNNKTYKYAIQFDNLKDKKVKIRVFPLTNDMKSKADKSDLNLDNFAYGEVILDVGVVKQDTINSIKGTDGGVGNGN